MAEFGLPSEFLVDDFFSEKHSEVQIKSGRGCRLSPELPGEWEYGSNLSSPGESVTETESSDEEDYMAGLTRQMAHYFLQEEEKNLNHVLPGKTTVPVGSPQSTLYAFSRESSNVPSLVSSPASSPLEQYNGDAWDVLYAASQVMRMKMNDEQPVRGLLGQPTRQTSPPLPKTAAPGSASSALNQNQLLARQFQQLKQEQLFKQQQSVPVWNRQNRTKVVLPRGEISNNRTWPPYPQQHRSGTRAVFLGLSSRRESCGTGVFLPRRVDSPADFRKKPACATVLLPARVVQALNLDLEELSAQSRFSGGFVLDHGAVAMVGRGNGMLLPRQTYRPQATQANSHHRGEIRLPSEWTY